MIVIIDFTDEQLAEIKRRHWYTIATTDEYVYNNIIKSERFAYIRNNGNIIGYVFIDYRSFDEDVKDLYYVSYCELREYAEPQSIEVHESKWGDYAKNLILAPEDEEVITNYLSDIKEQWWIPSYIQNTSNKDLALFKVDGNIITSPFKKKDTEFMCILMYLGYIEKIEGTEGDNYQYKIIKENDD